MSNHKILGTDDGSVTIFSEKFQATYHSTKGAITESQVVFIEAGLQYRIQQKNAPVKIFEMGFGTGLNAWLSFLFSETNQTRILYHTIEAFPLDPAIWSALEYSNESAQNQVYRHIHEAAWDKEVILSPFFTLHKTFNKLEDFYTAEQYDIIFYDAFAPRTQPDLWSDPIVKKMADMLLPGGILNTYCAQGEFKRCLLRNGFSLETLPGPPGKREIIRATKL